MSQTPSRRFFLFVLVVPFMACAQDRKPRLYERGFQLSLFPGISTNGIASGSYYNKYSFNLFGGLSAGNRVLEVGVITNSNFRSSTGIQVAGLANIIGTNAFVNLTLSEERSLIAKDFEASMQGIQIAGMLNYVLNNARGIQLSGAFNHVGENFTGLQIAGIGNIAVGTSLGVHIAGVYNLVKESVAGFQISTLFNYTDAQLSGMQIALINKARWIKGKKSSPPTAARGLQIGLLNFCKKMEGLQIGLINFGGPMRGKQIGLINFLDKYPSKEFGRMGTPIGLINIGTFGSCVRVFYNELYPFNFEFTTGNTLNGTWTQSGMPYYDKNRIFNQNALIFGYDPGNDTWGFGYGFQKFLYNKVTPLPKPENEKRMITYGVKFLHLNRDMALDRSFNLLNKFNFSYGKRRSGIYWFVDVSVNYFLFTEEGEGQNIYAIRSTQISTGKVFGMLSEVWPGYAAGVQYRL
jgi:hypothetical protein